MKYLHFLFKFPTVGAGAGKKTGYAKTSKSYRIRNSARLRPFFLKMFI